MKLFCRDTRFNTSHFAFKTYEDIDLCIKKFLKNQKKLVVSVTDSKLNPYFNMVTKTKKIITI